MKKLLLVGLMVLVWCAPALALDVVAVQGVSIYYPKGFEVEAGALKNEVPAMLDFLAAKGLKVKRPLHVILDAERDLPEVGVYLYPHRGLRIPLRAPDVMEEGGGEADPWRYFLFKGLSLEAVYSLRGGLIKGGYHVFGEIVTTNNIMPPWAGDGAAALLWREYSGASAVQPLDRAVFAAGLAPDFARINNHPESWPGYFGYRIYGRPFVEWLNRTYGWEALLKFFKLHGRGLIFFEVDSKSRKVYGRNFEDLWQDFISAEQLQPAPAGGKLALGFTSEPERVWDYYGVEPGPKRTRYRGRHGWYDAANQTLWLSEYDREGIARIVGYRDQVSVTLPLKHVWDPGRGRVAVHLKSGRPELLVLPENPGLFTSEQSLLAKCRVIAAPPGARQLSGPTLSADGRLAVAAKVAGNWDIWLHDGAAWSRLTSGPSLEFDPGWQDDRLVLVSDVSGSLQIHDASLLKLTDEPQAAVLPQAGRYLALDGNRWVMHELKVEAASPPTVQSMDSAVEPAAVESGKAYNPLKSLLPNYWRPDLYVGGSDVQFGLTTRSRDISGDFETDLGLRYSTDLKYTTLRLGARVFDDYGCQLSRYPLAYNPRLRPKFEESRQELQVYWRHAVDDSLRVGVNLNGLSSEMFKYESPRDKAEYILDQANRRAYPGIQPDSYWSHLEGQNEAWGGLEVSKSFGDLSAWSAAEFYSGGRKSASGGLSFRYGHDIYGVAHASAGRSWGDTSQGHGTFRIGGDVGEGYFTRRTSRLFPVRGFASNVLEADQAVSGGVEVYWPLANLQRGRSTLPVFLHRLWLGTFVDAGACADSLGFDDTLVGAGFELVTSMELGWGNLSNFRLGVAWPVRQPDYYPAWHPYNVDDLDEDGPRFILQLGLPL